MTDIDSSYFEIMGYNGGVMYCESCTATITNGNFFDTNSYNGGVFYLLDAVDVTLDAPKMSFGKAIGSGGAIYADKTGGDVAASVNFLNCGTLQADYFQRF